MSSIRKLAWVVTHPIQYQVPVFRELARMADLDLTVLYLTDHGMRPSRDPGFGVTMQWDVPLLDGYSWRLVAGRPQAAPFGRLLRAEGLRAELRAGSFDAVVVAGYSYLGYVEAIHTATRTGARVIHLWESTLEERERGLLVRVAKRAFFRALIRSTHHGLAVGARSRRYLEDAGVRRSQIHRYPYCVDTPLFEPAWARHPELRADARGRLGIPSDAPVFVFCGKLIGVKNPLLLVEAFRRATLEAHLLIVGAGELLEPCRALASGDPRVHFLGFKNQRELPAIYAAADVIVLPSHKEPWGLVVNEAMQLGCAAIVSHRVGAAPDLIEGKDTGLVVPADDVQALADALRAAVADPERLRRWQRNARVVVAAHTPLHAARGVREAVWAP